MGELVTSGARNQAGGHLRTLYVVDLCLGLDAPLLRGVNVLAWPEHRGEGRERPVLGEPVRHVVLRHERTLIGDLFPLVGLPHCRHIDHKPLLGRVWRSSNDTRHWLGVSEHGERKAPPVDALKVVLDDVGRVKAVGKSIRFLPRDAPNYPFELRCSDRPVRGSCPCRGTAA